MGILQDAGGSLSGSFKSGGFFSDLGNSLSGTSSDPGILGLGQYKAKGSDIDETAFKDQKALEKRSQNLAGALQALNTRKAPSVQAAQIAPTTFAPMREVGAAQINMDPSNEVRGQQMSLAAALQAQANGEGPSVAQAQLRQGTDRNIAQALALQASARGGSAGGLGLRQINQQTSTINQQAAEQSAILRAQEQMAARQQLAGVLEGTRGVDAQLAQNQAGLTQQANLANQAAVNQGTLFGANLSAQQAQAQAALQQQAGMSNQSAELQQQALQDAMASFYESQGGKYDMFGMQSAQSLQQLKAQQAATLAGINQQGYAAAGAARGNFVGKLGAAGMTAAGMPMPVG